MYIDDVDVYIYIERDHYQPIIQCESIYNKTPIHTILLKIRGL